MRLITQLRYFKKWKNLKNGHKSDRTRSFMYFSPQTNNQDRTWFLSGRAAVIIDLNYKKEWEV